MSRYEILSLLTLGLTLIAVFTGPIVAVKITRKGDIERERIRRKTEVLSILMRTRTIKLSFDHVSALNLIQLEFYGDDAVLNAYRAYISHLYKKGPEGSEEEASAFASDRNDLFGDLVFELGKHLGYQFDKRELQKLSYGPSGWYQDEDAVRMLRSMAIDVMAGKRTLPVSMRPVPVPGAMFPPPPGTAA
ncbi:MAG: DUF6680 family protein [Aurantimonas endophytica]|uniref:DUF6680 family protein n=1 Tax=Aurantimonas endophytica TaxID=1522175 RepID=UPI003002B7B4